MDEYLYLKGVVMMDGMLLPSAISSVGKVTWGASIPGEEGSLRIIDTPGLSH